MSTHDAVHPESDTWIAAVHASESDLHPLGAALVIDKNRLITCAHVVAGEGATTRDELWVAFSNAADLSGQRRRVRARVKDGNMQYRPPIDDLAVLHLDEPVPSGVAAAALRTPRPGDLVGKQWWAFGFANGDPVGNSADGLVGTSLSFGWVRLDAGSRYHVEPGFSGGGLWSPDYQAVVAVVGQANPRGDGRALTLHQAEQMLPGEKLGALVTWSAEEAGELALAAWGWTLASDPEAARHWRPRARGVTIESERGYRFRGRTAALRAIVAWLDRPVPDRRALVVTGSPGVGKSAVLGRIVTTADEHVRALLPAADEAVRATPGSVNCAVHAKAKTALEVATEIARAASASLPDDAEDLAPALRAVMAERGGPRFNVIIDALDEAVSPAQARGIITSVVLPLTETCSDVGVQVVVGTRLRDDRGGLLHRFGDAITIVDLDDPVYFSGPDLEAYSLACLQLDGDVRADNPYASDDAGPPVAARIAWLAERNFLVAGLIARAHGLHDQEAIDPDHLRFTVNVASALSVYLERLSPVSGIPADDVLTVLAFAEAPGLPVELWQLAIEALYGKRVTLDELSRFARSSAANFLVESGVAGGGRVFRLFHQALNDVLLRARAGNFPRAADERAIFGAFAHCGRQATWAGVPEYLLRSLATHAAGAGLIDELLTDDDYLLAADLRRLVPFADLARSPAAERRTRLLRLTPEAVTADPPERAALFSVTETLDKLGRNYSGRPEKLPYRAVWAAANPRTELATLAGHQGKVWAVCSLTMNGRATLASAGVGDPTVRIWDPVTGEQEAAFTGHRADVHAVCSFVLGGRTLMASAGHDGDIHVWNPATGRQWATLTSPRTLWGVCAFVLNGRVLLATGGDDRAVRIWDPVMRRQEAVLTGHQRAVNGVCAFVMGDRTLLASASDDRTVRIWDPVTGAEEAVLSGHTAWVRGVCAVTLDGRVCLASGSDDMTVRVWDLASGTPRLAYGGHRGTVMGVCALEMNGRPLVASVGHDRTVQIWDPATGTRHAVLTGHHGAVNGICVLPLGQRTLLASASADRTVRLWDPDTSAQQADPDDHLEPVNALCPLSLDGRDLIATANDDGTVRYWDQATGEPPGAVTVSHGPVKGISVFTLGTRVLLATTSGTEVIVWDPVTNDRQAVLVPALKPESNDYPELVNSLCAVTLNGRTALASAGDDGTVRIWDPVTGEQRLVLSRHRGAATALCVLPVPGQALLASAGDDRTVRIWNPATGTRHAVLAGHRGRVNGICALPTRNALLLASAGDDTTVRIWDPATGTERAVLTGHQGAVNGLCALQVGTRALLASASDDYTVRIWDPATALCVRTVPVHHEARAVMQIGRRLVVGLYAGLIAVDLDGARPAASTDASSD